MLAGLLVVTGHVITHRRQTSSHEIGTTTTNSIQESVGVKTKVSVSGGACGLGMCRDDMRAELECGIRDACLSSAGPKSSPPLVAPQPQVNLGVTAETEFETTVDVGACVWRGLHYCL